MWDLNFGTWISHRALHSGLRPWAPTSPKNGNQFLGPIPKIFLLKFGYPILAKNRNVMNLTLKSSFLANFFKRKNFGIKCVFFPKKTKLVSTKKKILSKCSQPSHYQKKKKGRCKMCKGLLFF